MAGSYRVSNTTRLTVLAAKSEDSAPQYPPKSKALAKYLRLLAALKSEYQKFPNSLSKNYDSIKLAFPLEYNFES